MDSDEEYYYYSDEEAYSNGEMDQSDSKSNSGEQEEEGKNGLETKESGNGGRVSLGSQLKVKAAQAQQLEYSILTPEVLRAEQDKVIRNVCDVLDTSYDISNVLLLHYKWNKEKLLDAYYADPTGTCEKAGCVMGDGGNNAIDGADVAGGGEDVNKMYLCNILFIEVPMKETYAMGCKSEDGSEHRFSLDAWQNYLRCKVEEGQPCIFTRCPKDGCQSLISPKVWEKVLNIKGEDESENEKNKHALSRYERFLCSSFVDINKNVKWCPGQDCGCAVQASGAVTEIKCSHCGCLFCFKCARESHAPIICTALETWEEKCQNESETANWILANTKKCPGCQLRIEKNQGCNHMTCRVCKYDFCWICMGDWKDHGTNTGGYYNCNKWKQSEETGDGDDSVSKAKRELDRYLHYYKRYAAHMQAGKFAAEQRSKAERRMVEMQSTSCVGWIDVQFLEQAVEQLIDCRRVLKYTYAFAYYLPPGPAKELFEYNQSMLESHTEKLSELSEMPLEKMNRPEVINYTRVTGRFLKSLLEQVENDGMGDMSAASIATSGKPDVEMEDASKTSSKKRAKTSTRRK